LRPTEQWTEACWTQSITRHLPALATASLPAPPKHEKPSSIQALGHYPGAPAASWHTPCTSLFERNDMLATLPHPFRRIAMKSTLMIKDLSLDQELGGHAMSAVRGGGSRDNAAYQSINQGMNAAINVGPTAFLGSGSADITVNSNPTQVASNTSSNVIDSGWGGFPFLRAVL
jgi:hypothetical protein